MITYFIYFGKIVMCQSQCRIEMSTFAAEWSTIAKSAVSNILYQSKHFPVRYHNMCSEAKYWLRIWTHEFQKLHFQVQGNFPSEWIIWFQVWRNSCSFQWNLPPARCHLHITLPWLITRNCFANMNLLIPVLNLSVFFSPWTSPWRKIFSKTVWPSQKR